MARKKKPLSKNTIFTTLIIAAVVLLLLPQNITKNLNFLFESIFNPFLSIGRPGPEEVFRMPSSEEDIVSRNEHDKLWIAYNNLRSDFRKLHDKYEKLAKIRSGLPKSGEAIVLAEVINSSISGKRQELVIDKGQIDGISEGQYVLFNDGQRNIIGTVSEISKAKSRVRLITDAKHNIKVLIWSEKMQKYLEAQMIGDGKDGAKIPLVRREYQISEGDTVYATAQKGFLATPRVIGEVSEVKRDMNSPLLWDITVVPVQSGAGAQEVAIIVEKKFERIYKK